MNNSKLFKPLVIALLVSQSTGYAMHDATQVSERQRLREQRAAIRAERMARRSAVPAPAQAPVQEQRAAAAASSSASVEAQQEPKDVWISPFVANNGQEKKSSVKKTVRFMLPHDSNQEEKENNSNEHASQVRVEPARAIARSRQQCTASQCVCGKAECQGFSKGGTALVQAPVSASARPASPVALNDELMMSCCGAEVARSDFNNVLERIAILRAHLNDPVWCNQASKETYELMQNMQQELAHLQTCPFCKHKDETEEVIFTSVDQAPGAVQDTSAVAQKECETCFTESDEKDFVTLSCGHNIACSNCLNGMLDIMIKEKNLDAFKCPRCNKRLTEADVRKITDLDADKLEKFSEIGLREFIMEQPNGRCCPGVDCSYAYLFEGKPRVGTCPKCNATYCLDCRINHSRNISCNEAKENAELGNDKDAAARATAAELARISKPCPRCSIRITRIGGCDHMTCKQCKHEFCWKCGSNYRDEAGYPIHSIHCRREEEYHPLQAAQAAAAQDPLLDRGVVGAVRRSELYQQTLNEVGYEGAERLRLERGIFQNFAHIHDFDDLQAAVIGMLERTPRNQAIMHAAAAAPRAQAAAAAVQAVQGQVAQPLGRDAIVAERRATRALIRQARAAARQQQG